MEFIKELPVEKTDSKNLSKELSPKVESFFVKYRKKFIYLHMFMLVMLLILMVVPSVLGLPEDGETMFTSFTLFSGFLMWGLWFPLVFLSVIFFGRLWCGTLCPQGALAEMASKFSLGRNVPKWLQKPIVPILSFIIITIIGQVVGVRDYPLPAMAIFLGTTVIAVIVGLIYGKNRRVWCRHLCPVGPLLGVLSRLGTVAIETDVKKGKAHICPTFLNTREKSSSSDCIECFKCVGTEENGEKGFATLKMTLRRPGSEIENIKDKDPSIYEVLFLFLSTGLALGAFHWLVNPLYTDYQMFLGGLFINAGLENFISYSGPWYTMVNYPEHGEVFTMLDVVTMTTFMAVFMSLVAFMLYILTSISWTFTERKEGLNEHVAKAGYLYAPVALVSLVIGLGSMLFEFLADYGLGDFTVNILKMSIFFIGALWSMYLAWVIYEKPGLKKISILVPSLAGVSLVATLWGTAIF